MQSRCLHAAPIPPACGSAASADPSIDEWAVGIDPAIAQERPIASYLIHLAGVALDDQHLFLIGRCLCDHLAERIRHKRRAPEFKPLIRRTLESDSIHRANIDTVGDGMRPLNSPPRIQLR